MNTSEHRQPVAQTAAAQVATKARRVVMALDLARRGLLPLSKLEAVADPRVLDQMGPFPPPTPGAPLGPARIGGVRVQMAGDRHAHVAAVAHGPTGQTTGYVLELCRDGAARPWTVTQLTRVQDRQLVTPEDPTDRRTRRLPANLDGLIAATRHARDQAAAQLSRAEQHQAAVFATPRHTQRQRDAHAREASDARADVKGWRERLDDIDRELDELHDAAALRDMRDAALAGDPLMSPRLNQLQILLGPPPDRDGARDPWKRAARRLLDYAAVWDVDDLLRDLPSKGHRDPDSGQRNDRHAMRALVDDYRHDRGWAPLQRLTVQDLRPGDRVLMGGGPHQTLTYQGLDPDSGRCVFQDDDGRTHHRNPNATRTLRLWPADQRAHQLPTRVASEDRTPQMEHLSADHPEPDDQLERGGTEGTELEL